MGGRLACWKLPWLRPISLEATVLGWSMPVRRFFAATVNAALFTRLVDKVLTCRVVAWLKHVLRHFHPLPQCRILPLVLPRGGRVEKRWRGDASRTARACRSTAPPPTSSPQGPSQVQPEPCGPSRWMCFVRKRLGHANDFMLKRASQ
jgi:hypothetical protein